MPKKLVSRRKKMECFAPSHVDGMFEIYSSVSDKIIYDWLFGHISALTISPSYYL